MVDFGSKYSKTRPTKDHGHEPATKKKLRRQQENSSIVQHTVGEIILKENKKLRWEDVSHENIDYDIDEDDLYEIDNMSLDENKEKKGLGKRAVEIKLEYIYDINIQNGMTCIHENEVSKIFECNLLHDILNPFKRTKKLNIYYCAILHGCMNTWKGKAKLKNFRILLDSGCSSKIVMVRLIKN